MFTQDLLGGLEVIICKGRLFARYNQWPKVKTASKMLKGNSMVEVNGKFLLKMNCLSVPSIGLGAGN